MPCGGYSNYCNIAGYYTDYVPPFENQNTTCYKWNNTNECGEAYFIDNLNCYKNTPHSNYTNYANVPHENRAAWSNSTFSTNWSNHTNYSVYDPVLGVTLHTNYTPHSNYYTHTDIPFYNDPWYNWNNHSNSPFRNFCNHTDTYI